MPPFLPTPGVSGNPASRPLRHARKLLSTLAMLTTTAAIAAAQPGSATFVGPQLAPTVNYSGATLAFSSRILAGFGNQTDISPALPALLWPNMDYSGRQMLYGNNARTGNVLELRFEAASGLNLTLSGALFGGWSNAARYVGYQLFNGDYSQSTTLATILTGTTTPGVAMFGANGWGNIIRLQFTEHNAAGAAFGRGPFDVGVQDIDYNFDGSAPIGVVPEPESFVLLATGLVVIGVGMHRRRAHQA